MARGMIRLSVRSEDVRICSLRVKGGLGCEPPMLL
jgi:hypothetical protein